MLQIKNISKQYITGELTQQALNDVSLNFRDNEFVAILGPSGSGKTTLLNIIGGLDRYDTGDLVINEISTKEYKDRDWDSYRNHTIGFVFQSYNLIPHQTVLSNVELALTISGISKNDRKARAIEALEKVGLGAQLHKNPNQMSGGQMQRVAIARALVNNPDILLADEPTGALDTETSVQIMDLLKEVAKDRLVIMVTHNPELAVEYATRVVKMKDGVLLDDSNPLTISKEDIVHDTSNMGKASISFLTSLSLSFNNLRTKKARTLLTAFAGSIGIIGIALIIAFSTGVNTYISDIQKETMSSYPLVIEQEAMDLSSMMAGGPPMAKLKTELDHALNGVYSNSAMLELINEVSSNLVENNLSDFKYYLDDNSSEIHEFIGENGIIYSYDTKFDIFTHDAEDNLIHTDGNTTVDFEEKDTSTNTPPMPPMGPAAMMGSTSKFELFGELIPGNGDDLISPVVKDSYDLVHGNWPTSKEEIVLVLDVNNEVDITSLYSMGLLPYKEYNDMLDAVEDGEDVEFKDYEWNYEDISKQTFSLVPASDYYVKNKKGTYDYIGDDKNKVDELSKEGLELKIAGIIKPVEDASNATFTGVLGYTSELTDYIIETTNASEVLKAQGETPDIDILTGIAFEPKDDDAKVTDAKSYISKLNTSDKATLATMLFANNPTQAQGLQSMSESQIATMVDQSLNSLDREMLISIYDNTISGGSLEDNLDNFGFVSLDAPSSISIYSDTFESKEGISQSIANYNDTVSEDDEIIYTDFVELMTSSLTTIINVVSYVLIAFVAVSLIVSSVMIGIITYISVIERTKEIGILRALGASKKNITQIFTAETFIIGFCSGLIGIGSALLLTIPANKIIQTLLGNPDVSARLPLGAIVILIILSIFITFLGGLIPSKNASKKDPVAALRTE